MAVDCIKVGREKCINIQPWTFDEPVILVSGCFVPQILPQLSINVINSDSTTIGIKEDKLTGQAAHQHRDFSVTLMYYEGTRPTETLTK